MRAWLHRYLVWDQRLAEACQATLDHYRLRWGARLLAHTGDGLLWICTGGLLWLSQSSGLRIIGLRILLGVAMTGLISGVLKRIFRRKRPAASDLRTFLPGDDYAFPSGHAVRVGALVAILSTVLPAPGLFLWGLGVALARVALAYHYPGDVAWGLALGLALGYLLPGGG